MKYKVTLNFVHLDLCNDEKKLSYVHYYNSLSDLNDFFKDYLTGRVTFIQGHSWVLIGILFDICKDS